MTHNLIDVISYILNGARFSPSSHNTQPWTVKINEDYSIIIGYNPDRQLRVADPNKKELFVSIGCFIESISCIAEEIGYIADYQYISNLSLQVAKITFTQNKIKQNNNKNKWYELIKSRHSDRRLYENKKIEDSIINRLSNLLSGKANLKIFTDPKDIAFIAKMTNDATLNIMSNRAFREELSSWVRHNWTNQKDGMPAYTQGIPGPISLIAPRIIVKSKKIPVNQAKLDSKRIMHSSAIGIILSDNQDTSTLIDAGRLYQKTSLLAESLKIKTSGISAAVVDSKTNNAIIEHFFLRKVPVALLRFGYIKKNARSTPRLNHDDFSI